MFLHLSVFLFTGGSLSGGSLSRGSLSRGSLSRGEGLCLGGSLSGGSPSRGVSVRETPQRCTAMFMRYASYWNAFLFDYYIYIALF